MNVFVKPKDPRGLAHLGVARKRTFKNLFMFMSKVLKVRQNLRYFQMPSYLCTTKV